MIYAMSDIHGCIEELQKQMEQVDLSGKNRIIFLGDYIDYGDKDITDELLATFTCPAGYTFTLTLKDSDGNSVTWDDVDDPVNGPYTIDAYTEEDTTTT